MAETFSILGIPSTLRAASFNTGLLRAAREVAPDGVTVNIYPIQSLPFYDQDLEASGEPPMVRDFRDQIRSADALLITTAEYSHSITGLLKNALDWASRPLPNHPLLHKPVALISATGGAAGGIRAKLAILPVLEATESHLMMRPELMIGSARQKFDTEGNLTDEELRARLGTVISSLIDFTQKMKSIG